MSESLNEARMPSLADKIDEKSVRAKSLLEKAKKAVKKVKLGKKK